MPRKNGAKMLTFQDMPEISTPIGAAVKRFAQTLVETRAVTILVSSRFAGCKKLTDTHLHDAVDWLFCEWYMSKWIDARKPHVDGLIEHQWRNLTPAECQFLPPDL